MSLGSKIHIERSFVMNFTKVLLAIVGIAFLGGCASGGIMQPSSQAARTENCKVTTEQEIASLFDR